MTDIILDMERRNLIKGATGASAMMTALSGTGKASSPTAPSPVAALAAAGLDPLTVYRKMFASTDKNNGWYWLFTGPFPIEVDGVGPVYFAEEETMRAMRTVDIGHHGFHIDWLEAGIIRDMQTGNVAVSAYNPITGLGATRSGVIHTDKKTRFTIEKSGDTLSFAMMFPTAPVLNVTAAAAVHGDRVSLTVYTRYKFTRASTTAHCSTFKIYSSLAALKSDAPAVATQGFYSTRDLETGTYEVSGIMQKARIDEKLNPLAWERVRGFYPEFFDGDRIAMNWT